MNRHWDGVLWLLRYPGGIQEFGHFTFNFFLYKAARHTSSFKYPLRPSSRLEVKLVAAFRNPGSWWIQRSHLWSGLEAEARGNVAITHDREPSCKHYDKIKSP